MRRLSYGQAIRSALFRISIFVMLNIALVVVPGNAQSSPHGPLSIPCTDCHTTDSWKELARPMRFNHVVTGFSLEGQHINAACIQCHTTKKFSGTPTGCFTCHQKDFVRALMPNHQLGKFSHDCLTCHTVNAWRPSIFQHSKTNFQLISAHQSVDCASCHTNNKFAGLSHDCFFCHQKDFSNTSAPRHVQGRFSHDCLTCHTMNGWSPASFDHAKTNFPLTGAHKTVDCSGCHAGGKYTALTTDCFSCHQQDFSASVSPKHAAGKFSHDCLTCHTINGWKPSTFDHAKTEFALVGAHGTTECADCHSTGQFKGLTKDCFVCHTKAFNDVKEPSHVTAQFDHNCLTCHDMNKWKPSTFDHAKTNYPLTGAHTKVECASCHVGGVYKGLTNDCYSCHQKAFSQTVAPNHATGQFSHDCLSCHSINAWKPSTFDHAKTNFPLLGAHISTDCASCHSGGKFNGTSTDCYTCHLTDFTKTTSPNHAASQFSHDCLSCHSMNGWKPSTFNHNATLFPLTGSHVAVACASCHSSGVFKGLPSDCFSCHQTDFTSTTNPNHATAQFSHDCQTCHTTSVWKPSTFNHTATAFPLVGAHSAVACASCHSNGVFKGLPSDCFSCHQTDFTSTTNPNHATAQFSHECLTCHTTTVWKPSTFNHANTSFPLVGAHAAVVCTDCHKNGIFKGTSTDCFACHTTDFNSVADPNHATNIFDHNCLTCHAMTAWKPATFNHSKTTFPLTGAHVSVVCASCHVGGKFAGTTTDCFTCHQTKYQATTNPNHVSGVYTQMACTSCHTTTAWKPWIFGHDSFYKISKHHNSSVTCVNCHTAQGNLGFASCTTGCHSNAHNKNQTCYTSNCHGGSRN